jgi:hypothetical protein
VSVNSHACMRFQTVMPATIILSSIIIVVARLKIIKYLYISPDKVVHSLRMYTSDK